MIRMLMLLFASLLSFSGAQAQTAAVPGRSVGRVFLGMERADVWKILQKPHRIYTVPHGMSLYSEDDWNSGNSKLEVVCEHDKVIQIEFNSPRFTTPDGLSTQASWSQVRRRHPSMTVKCYDFEYGYDASDAGAVSYYVDDTRQGITFTLETPQTVEPQDINTLRPSTIVTHRPGFRAVPIYEGHWVKFASDDDPGSLRVIRNWFTPKGARR